MSQQESFPASGAILKEHTDNSTSYAKINLDVTGGMLCLNLQSIGVAIAKRQIGDSDILTTGPALFS